MKIIKLFEEFVESELDTEIQKEFTLIQNMIDDKQIRLKVDRHNIVPMDSMIIILDKDWSDEIKEKHLRKNTSIGSTFFADIDLRKLILNTIKEKKPTVITNGQYKWMGVIANEDPIGIDNIKKTNNFKKLKQMKDYKVEEGEMIKVAYEDGRETRHINIIADEIGKLKNVPVLSIVTAFPGNTGLEVDNRNEFSSFGYYFTSKSEIVKELYDIDD
jgi:hypothetical protein